MLSFLRKVRRKNFDSSKMKKVVLYALGEIFLVVIGILIAVQLNNWNNQRKLDQVEKITLSRLEEDLRSDIQRYEFLDRAISKKIGLCDSAAQLLEKQSSSDERLHVIGIDFLSFYLLEPNTTTYDEMLNTGRLYSLSNDTLRSKIIKYYRQVQKWGKYAEKTNDQIGNAMNRAGLNDYWILESRIRNDRNIDVNQFPWLNQLTSKELKEIESFIYTTRSGLADNRRAFSYLSRVCEGLLTNLEQLN